MMVTVVMATDVAGPRAAASDNGRSSNRYNIISYNSSVGDVAMSGVAMWMHSTSRTSAAATNSK